MTIRRIHALDVDDARKFLVELVKRGMGDKEHDSLEKLRLTEEHLRTVMHEAAEELRGVQGEIMIRIRQNYEARQVATP